MRCIRLQSSEGDIFSLDEVTAKQSTTLTNMMQSGISMKENDAPVELPNVRTLVLNKVVLWCIHYRDHPPSQDGVPREESNANNIILSPWDEDFFKVDQDTMFQIILAASFLEVRGLLEKGCTVVAEGIKGKKCEEIRKLFNIKNFTPQKKTG